MSAVPVTLRRYHNQQFVIVQVRSLCMGKNGERCLASTLLSLFFGASDSAQWERTAGCEHQPSSGRQTEINISPSANLCGASTDGRFLRLQIHDRADKCRFKRFYHVTRRKARCVLQSACLLSSHHTVVVWGILRLLRVLFFVCTFTYF